MRCKNCGWENQEGSIRCSKCNAPLTGSMVDRGPAPAAPVPEHPLSGTVKEAPEAYQPYEPQAPQAAAPAPAEVSSCPRCGYPTRPDMNVCPSCGVPLKQKMGGTVNSWI
ncbi:MAG: zinc-ribbon domain-containing protein, partial [Bacteroidales bacterium]|nr:zinc-ribbon domain-containing protein [Bacteroidales bacterium]